MAKEAHLVLTADEYRFSKTLSESDVYMFAGITGDFSRYHVDEEYMKASQFGGRVAHGVLVLGMVSTASTLFWSSLGASGQGISLGYDKVRFVNPVMIGDTLTACYRVTDWLPDVARYHAEAKVLNSDGDVCLAAVHVTKVLASPEGSEPSGVGT